MTENALSEKRLRIKYRKRISAKLATLEKIISNMESGPVAPGPFEKLKFLVHKIHGSAGSFGFDESSSIAAEWDLWLRAVSAKMAVAPEDIARMRKMLADLRNSMA